MKEWIPVGATLSACSTSCPPLRKIRNLSSFIVRHFSVRADTTRAELPVLVFLQLDLGKQPHLASSGRAWQLLRKQLFPERVKSRKGRQDRRLSLMAGACMAILSELPPSFSSLSLTQCYHSSAFQNPAVIQFYFKTFPWMPAVCWALC